MATVDLWITAGQSNMRGRGDINGPAVDPALCWEWGDTDGLTSLSDPGANGGTKYDANVGSCLPMFAHVFTAWSERPSVIVRCAVGGTALLAANATTSGDWSPTGALFDDATTRTNSAITDVEAAGHTIDRINVLWCQGERDAIGGADLHLYRGALQDLPGRFRTALSEPDLRVYVARSGTNDPTATEGKGWRVVRNAQDAACWTEPGLVMGHTAAEFFFDRGLMKADDIHWSQPALDAMGADLARRAILDLAPRAAAWL